MEIFPKSPLKRNRSWIQKRLEKEEKSLAEGCFPKTFSNRKKALPKAFSFGTAFLF